MPPLLMVYGNTRRPVPGRIVNLPNPLSTAFTKIIQNGNTFTYVDGHGIHTGRVSGKNYIAVISYYEDGGITTETLFVTLSSNTYGTGRVTWTWTDGI